MARIGRALGIGVVAVGVECDRQRQIAKQMACTHAQGYHSAIPATPWKPPA